MRSRLSAVAGTTLVLLLALCSSTAVASSEHVDDESYQYQNSNITDATVFDHLDAWKHCSLGDKEWSICLAPTGWGAMWYCPSIDPSIDPVRGDSTPLEDIIWYGSQMSFLPCFACPKPGSPYGDDCNATMTKLVEIHNIEGTSALNKYEMSWEGLEYCKDLCEAGETGEACSDDNKCTAGSHFCNYDESIGSGSLTNIEGECKECPADLNDCLALVTSPRSRRECFSCRLGCYDVGNSILTVDGEMMDSTSMGRATQKVKMHAEGAIVDCSDLILADIETCPGAEGKVCLVDDYTFDTHYATMTQKAEDNGCIAIILFGSSYEGILATHHSHDYLDIPVVTVDSTSGQHLKEMGLGGSIVKVETKMFGNACFPSWDFQACTDEFGCQEEGKYCDFEGVFRDGEYVEGYCDDCPTTGEHRGEGEPDPAGCFFNRRAGSDLRTQKQVESCAKTCNAGAEITFNKNCKFCPNDISAFEFGVENEVDKCRFCPENDVIYGDRHVPLFGENITCWNMQAFFERLDVHKDSVNCVLAQSFNYICGCAGPGYAGASTSAKRKALVWVPRATAILSGLGSLFVLIDILRVRKRREGIFHQLMIQMSVFDIMGSVAYALTSLPIPSEYFFDGASGNEASCTAQGFFIQVGTVACYTNVSLAVYYFLVVQKGWRESQLKKVRLWLFVCPITVGMTFAFAGIPFYDNMLLWCNNAAGWWPDIPVAIAIFSATLIMGSVCWDVHKTHQASKKYTQGGGGSSGNSVSTKVFWQSFWYLMSFYMTWSPYLALQFIWASGRGYGNYGFILYAGAVVPLQGAWNCFVYARNRQLKNFRENASNAVSSLGSRLAKRLSSSAAQDATTATRNP